MATSQPRPGQLADDAPSSGRRAASTTVRVAGRQQLARRWPGRCRCCRRAGRSSAVRRGRSSWVLRSVVEQSSAGPGRCPHAGRVDRGRAPPATRRGGGSRGGSRRASCASPWPGRGGRRRRARARRARRAARRARAPGGDVEGQRPARHREAERAGLAAPNRFSTARKLAVPAPARRSTTVRSAASCAERHDELVLQEAAPAVQPVPRADASSGWKKDEIDSICADAAARRLAVPDLVERRDRRVVEQAGRAGRAAARRRAGAGRRPAGRRRRDGASSSSRGVVAAGQHAAAEARPLATRSIQATE